MKYIKLFESFKENLKSTLIRFNIPVENWGKGKAKSIEHLQKEIDNKETTLDIINDELIRTVYVVAVAVEYNNKRLIEDKQEFNDGRVRRRGTRRCGEKCIVGESPEESAVRCIQEEIGIKDVTINDFTNKEVEKLERMSMSYPGLKSIYYATLFTYNMPEKFYKPEGYVEVQSDKKTYFIWD